MNFYWFNIFNKTDFDALNLISKDLTLNLESIGPETFIITKGFETSVVFRDVILPIQFFGKNPTIREGELANYAVYKDTNEDVWVGIEDK
jgi:hypothetical protein